MKSLSSFLLMSMLCLQLFSCKSSPNNENQSVSSIPTNQIDFAMNGFYYASSIPSIVLEIQEKGKAFEMNEIAFGSVRALGEIQFINEEKTQFRVAEEQGESAPLYTLDKSTKTIKLRKYNANTDEYDNIAYVQKSQKVDYNSYQNKVALFVAKLYGKDIKDLDNNDICFIFYIVI